MEVGEAHEVLTRRDSNFDSLAIGPRDVLYRSHTATCVATINLISHFFDCSEKTDDRGSLNIDEDPEFVSYPQLGS